MMFLHIVDSNIIEKNVNVKIGKYEPFRKVTYRPSKTPEEKYFHYYPDLEKFNASNNWNRSISLYKNQNSEKSRQKWIKKTCGADAIYEPSCTSPLNRMNFSSSFESTSQRFHDPEQTFPLSSGARSYLKISASTTGKDVGPGSYDVSKPLSSSYVGAGSSFMSRSQRLFPNRVMNTSGPVSLQMSSPYQYDPSPITKNTKGGMFGKDSRFTRESETKKKSFIDVEKHCINSIEQGLKAESMLLPGTIIDNDDDDTDTRALVVTKGQVEEEEEEEVLVEKEKDKKENMKEEDFVCG